MDVLHIMQRQDIISLHVGSCRKSEKSGQACACTRRYTGPLLPAPLPMGYYQPGRVSERGQLSEQCP